MWDLYTTEYYSAIKGGNPSFVTTGMNLEDIVRREIRQAEEDSDYCVISVTRGLETAGAMETGGW